MASESVICDLGSAVHGGRVLRTAATMPIRGGHQTNVEPSDDTYESAEGLKDYGCSRGDLTERALHPRREQSVPAVPALGMDATVRFNDGVEPWNGVRGEHRGCRVWRDPRGGMDGREPTAYGPRPALRGSRPWLALMAGDVIRASAWQGQVRPELSGID